MLDSEIDKVNNYLKEQLWMDFEMCRMDDGRDGEGIEVDMLEEGDDEGREAYMVGRAYFGGISRRGRMHLFLSHLEGRKNIAGKNGLHPFFL